uniref:Uncharacterized protein n=1 Tax=Pipistrellus kuhlii TaxID=59472 RepID=A0A7J7UG96_PIPKU|nr:hypothetical protein mPipKuh1_009066 [Pipistrellus kuhlii]
MPPSHTHTCPVSTGTTVAGQRPLLRGVTATPHRAHRPTSAHSWAVSSDADTPGGDSLRPRGGAGRAGSQSGSPGKRGLGATGADLGLMRSPGPRTPLVSLACVFIERKDLLSPSSRRANPGRKGALTHPRRRSAEQQEQKLRWLGPHAWSSGLVACLHCFSGTVSGAVGPTAKTQQCNPCPPRVHSVFDACGCIFRSVPVLFPY